MRNALNEECDKINLVDNTDSFESSDSSEIEDNSDGDLIMDTIETDSNLDEDQDSMDIGFDDEQDDRIADPAPYVVQTRYGRHCGSSFFPFFPFSFFSGISLKALLDETLKCK